MTQTELPFIGHLSNGEAVRKLANTCYAIKSGFYVEKDAKYLVEATAAEREEIHQKWPELKAGG